MAANRLRQPGQVISPLVKLAAYLQKARDHTDTFSLPPNTSQAVQQSLAQRPRHDAEEVKAIINAVDNTNPPLCSLLDAPGVTILCSIFLYSQDSLAQQRGFCLLAESLSSELENINPIKKVQLGAMALTPLIKGFVDTKNSEQTRRWMGVLGLELLKGCPENVQKLQDSSDLNWQQLSEVIKHGRCQVLKLVAGMIICELLSRGISTESFWSTERDRDVSSRFPLGQHQEMEWLISYEAFVDDLVLEKILTQEVSSVMFAHGVFIEETFCRADEMSAIIVTASSNLNIIVVPTGQSKTARFVDVPFHNIQEVTSGKNLDTQSQSLTYGITLQLSSREEDNYHVNAVGRSDPSIGLAFKSESDVMSLEKIIQPMENKLKKGLRMLRSEHIDTSQSLPEDQPAVTTRLSTNIKAIVPTASRATEAIWQNPPIGTVYSAMIGLGSTSHPSQASPRKMPSEMPSEMPTRTSQAKALSDMHTAMAMSPITFSQSRISTNAEIESKMYFGRTSDTGLAISARWKKAFGGISQKPKFCEKDSRQTDQLEETPGLLQEINEGDEEHDELYDATPKKGGHQTGKQAVSTPPQVERKQKEEMQEKVVDKTETRHLSTKHAPGAKSSGKLSRSLRNDNGEVEVGVSPLPNMNLDTNTEGGPKRSVKIKHVPKTTAKISSKTQTEVQKQTRLARSSILSRTKEKHIADRHGDDGDDFELPDSPPRPRPRPRGGTPRARALKEAKPTKRTDLKKGKQRVTSDRSDDGQSEPDLSVSPARSKSKRDLTKVIPGAESGPNEAVLAARTQDKARSSRKPALAASLQPATKGLPKSTVPRFKSAKNVKDESEIVWDVNLVLSESGEDSVQQGKKARNKKQPVKALKSGKLKGAQTQVLRKRPPKSKRAAAVPTQPAPSGLAQPKSKRAAALAANQKIQDLDEVDDISDVDVSVHKPPQKKASAATAKQDCSTLGPLKGRVNKEITRDMKDQRSSGTRHPDPEKPMKDSIHAAVDNASLDKETKTVESPTVRRSLRASGPENVNLVDAHPSKLETLSEDEDKVEAMEMEGDAEGFHFQAALPYTDEDLTDLRDTAAEPSGPGAEIGVAQAPTAPMLSEGIQNQPTYVSPKVQVSKSTNSPQRAQDLFTSRLGNFVREKDRAMTQATRPEDVRNALPSQAPEKMKPKPQEELDADNFEHPVRHAHRAMKTVSTGPRRPAAETKLRPSANFETISARTKPDEDAGTPLPDPHRKSLLISFDASGPKNQGTILVGGSRFTTDVRAIHPREEEPQGPHTQKRKVAAFVDDRLPWEHAQLAKRQKHSNVTPSVRKSALKPIRKPSPLIVQEKVQRLSSQSTRVDENGSPLPFVHSRIGAVAARDNLLENEETVCIDNGEQFVMHDEEPAWAEPYLPVRANASISEASNLNFVNLSSNAKQQPSSPHAASIFASMPVHHLYHGGQIVNTKTNEAIVPAKPQDPFVGATTYPPGTFMTRLRNATEMGHQRQSEGVKKQRPLAGKARKSLAMEDDPEDTLVEAALPRKRRKLSPLSNSTSSSHGTSSRDSSPSDEPDEESYAETVQWQQMYEPHQGNMLEVLSHISNRLVRHLVDEETAIKDITSDYAKGGSNLADHFEKERQRDVDSKNAKNAELQRSLITMFGKAQADLAKIANEKGRRTVKDVETRWRAEQQGLMTSLDAAIAACHA